MLHQIGVSLFLHNLQFCKNFLTLNPRVNKLNKTIHMYIGKHNCSRLIFQMLHELSILHVTVIYQTSLRMIAHEYV